MNLLAFQNGAQVRGLVENTPLEQITLTTSDCHPDSLRFSVGQARPAIVHNDLKVVRILGEEASLELWMGSPAHDGFDGEGITRQQSPGIWDVAVAAWQDHDA